MREQNGQDEDDKILDSLIRLPIMLMILRRNQVKISVNLIVVAVFVRSLKGLQPRIHGIENDLMLLDQVLNNHVERVLAH